jgi:transposase
LQIELSPGQMHDAPMAELLLHDLPEGTDVLADKGYDADWIRELIEDQGCTPVIPPKSNRTEDIPSQGTSTESETSSNAASTSSSSSATLPHAMTAKPQPIWLLQNSPPCDCGSGFMSLRP